MRCRVVLADDLEPLRSLARALLEESQKIEVVGEASDGVEAIAAVLAFKPDVLLLDLSMPNVDGLQVLLHLRAQRVTTRIVVFSSHSRDRLMPLLIDAGATAYVEKGATPEVLVRAVLDACAAPPPVGERAGEELSRVAAKAGHRPIRTGPITAAVRARNH